MTPHAEINLSRSSRKRFCRAWTLCLFVLLLLPALSSGAVAANNPERAQRWDYWGRSVAVKYRIDLSRDDDLCKAVVVALNERKVSDRPVLSYGMGMYSDLHRLHVRIPSLYQNPVFVTWMPHALSRRGYVFFQPVEWVVIPLYNDGRDVAVARATFVRTHSAPQSLEAFDDVEFFKEHEWRDSLQLFTNEAGVRLLQGKVFNNFASPRYIPPPIVPPELRRTQTWKLLMLNGFMEFDLIRFAEKIYVFMRDPSYEVAVVSEVHRDRTANAICFIGPTKYPFAKR